VETEGGNAVTHQAEQDYFDPASVPLVKWADYEASRKDSSSNSDTKSKMSYATGYGYTNSVAPSNYSESVVGSTIGFGADYVPPVGFPSDQELLQEIRHILSTTDLMKITKKSVRDQLSRLFGVDVSPRKEYIHYCIDGILKGEL
jgi:chitin synthase